MSEAIFVEGLTKTYYAKGDAEDRQRFPADAGTYDDEKHIFRHQHRERLAADWSHAWSCRTLHNPCCPLLPMGIKRSKIFRPLKSEAEQPNMF